jgi:hypothetical protein
MTPLDVGHFERAFRRLSVAYRLREKPGVIEEMCRTYFKVLEDASLDAVLAAGKVCLETLKKFPAASEWRANLPAVPPPSSEVSPRWMGTDEAAELLRAERRGYTDDPCGCLECQAAGVTDRPLRFVPNTSDDAAYCPAKAARVLAGHWAHGEELARWYAARAAFMHTSTVPRFVSRRALALVGAGTGREPGEEG